MEELKPCPFCGGEAEIRRWHVFGRKCHVTVQCKKCKANSGDWHNKKRAIDGWNRRTNDGKLND